MVRGADVPPSREAQTLYTTVAETAAVRTVGRESHAEFVIARRVPVERVSFVLAPEFKGNFSREVRVTAIADAKPAAAQPGSATADDDVDTDARAPLPEVITGKILSVHETLAGRKIASERLGVAAILGANLQRAAKIDVAIENGAEQPLPIAAGGWRCGSGRYASTRRPERVRGWRFTTAMRAAGADVRVRAAVRDVAGGCACGA